MIGRTELQVFILFKVMVVMEKFKNELFLRTHYTVCDVHIEKQSLIRSVNIFPLFKKKIFVKIRPLYVACEFFPVKY